MGSYCKAYPIDRFREFAGWSENLQNTRKEKREIDGQQVEVARELTDADFLYLQENYVVTDSIFQDENIIFSDVSDAWIDYCLNNLKFEVPVRESAKRA